MSWHLHIMDLANKHIYLRAVLKEGSELRI